MQLEYRKARVFENTEIADGIFKIAVEKSGEAMPKPGQFMMLRSSAVEPFLSRPISIHDADDKCLYFVFEARGLGTKLLSTVQRGSEIEILGPLGNGFDIANMKGKAAVVAGGLGIAPMSYLIKALKNCQVDLYAGFRSEVYGIDDIRKYVDKLYISTEDGSIGAKGYVTEVFKGGQYDAVLCCGPEPMMRSIVEICREQNLLNFVSMEKHMACGVGACLVCTCKTKEGNKRACKDGPVFSGRDVIFDA